MLMNQPMIEENAPVLRGRLFFFFIGCAILSIPAIASAQSTRPGWGAIPYHDAQGTGVTFRVWAPNATNVTVPGQFNNWSMTAHPLVKEGTNGVWSRDITTASPGQEYKFLMNVSIWKRDPRSRNVVSTTVYA